MKKAIILMKTQGAMKTFAPPFFSHFNSSLNRKKPVVMRAMREKPYVIHASAADLLHIRIENLDWCKFGHWKKEARVTDCLYYREMDAMLIVSAKIPEREGSISPFNSYGQLPNYSHTC